MPDTNQPPASGGGLGANLKAKMGPLPVWAWLALITVVLLGYWLLTKNKSGASSTAQQGTPSDVGQPGVVVINQEEPDTDTGSTAAPPPPVQPGGPNKPPREPQTRQIRITENETLGELAKQRHWSDATLKRVEQLNVVEGKGKLTPKSRLRKGQTIVRPVKGP